ncbi:histone deacetylase family protein [Natronobiforma cellulositropha]|uniref:histone deacetylase family protein n=1 Tax=Natronobiforma cellulositropha TaxID=1679076 RepID=UPI0021D5A5F9|nr:histone deacetylase [Natronobiforma cellulositropha]
MRFGYSDVCLEHDPGARHPETPDRLRAIREGLKRKHGVEYVDAPPASFETMAAVHDRDYLESLREFCAAGGGDWDPDTTAVEESWDAIAKSAGLACWAAESALEGADGRETPFALGRPPGHHAVFDDAMGFCFVNNVAVAAQHALDDCGCDRVAIVDWDVHHGNGTQDIFADREDVFVISLHEQGLYPGTGAADEIGTGAGAGATMNVPMPPGSDDVDYLAAFDDVVDPALAAFDPDCVLVSAGFDAHKHDPISRIRLSTETYALASDRLRTVAADTDAALAFVLEGGYGLDVLAESIAMVHETFDGRPPIEPDGDVSDDVAAVLETVTDAHESV